MYSSCSLVALTFIREWSRTGHCAYLSLITTTRPVLLIAGSSSSRSKSQPVGIVKIQKCQDAVGLGRLPKNTTRTAEYLEENYGQKRLPFDQWEIRIRTHVATETNTSFLFACVINSVTTVNMAMKKKTMASFHHAFALRRYNNATGTRSRTTFNNTTMVLNTSSNRPSTRECVA